jgi:cell division protein FtsZ
MDGARGVLLSIAGGSDLGLFEINDAAQLVTDAAHPDANIIFGAVIDDALGDEVRVTVIAAGFDGGTPSYKPAEPARKVVHQATPGNSVAPSSPVPLPVASSTQATTPPPRRVLFDDVDVPDFLKNGS